jgi:hypothetical protein
VRPWLERICQVLPCQLQPFRDASKIQVQSRSLKPAAGNIDGFRFELVMVNHSSAPQAFPAIQLHLNDGGGLAIATRTFRAEEYLRRDQPRSMPVSDAVTIELLLAKPSRSVAGLSFDFF